MMEIDTIINEELSVYINIVCIHNMFYETDNKIHTIFKQFN